MISNLKGLKRGHVADKNPVIRDHGCFGFQPIAGFVKHDPGKVFGPYQQMGLNVNTHFLYGSMRSDDGKRYYAPIRHFNYGGTLSFQLYAAETGKDFSYVKDSYKAYRGIIQLGQFKDGRWGGWTALSEPEPRFALLTDETICYWQEKNFLSLDGKVVGHCNQIAIPDTKFPFIYTNRGFKGKGEVLGDKVTGYFFQDCMHLGINQDWFNTEYFTRIEGAWVVFVTEFEDGNIHMGNLLWGAENWSVAVIQRTDGDPIIATGIDIELKVDEDGYATHVAFKVTEEEVWEWFHLGDKNGRIPTMPLIGSPHWVEGVVMRHGETRKWTHSDAWMETIRDHLKED